jgi:hypothetical protein
MKQNSLRWRHEGENLFEHEDEFVFQNTTEQMKGIHYAPQGSGRTWAANPTVI